MQTYVLEDNGTDQLAKPSVLIWEGDLDALGGATPLVLPGETARRVTYYHWVQLGASANPEHQRGIQYVVVGPLEENTKEKP